MSGGQSPSWRKSSKPSKRPSGPQPGWRKSSEGAPAAKTGLTRRKKLALYLGGFLVLCGLIVTLLYLLIPPRPAGLAFVFADYDTNLAVPLNLSGIDEVARTTSASGLGGQVTSFWDKRPKLLAEPIPLKKSADWKKWLSATGSEKSIVLFFDVLGSADEHGPYLIVDSPGGRERLHLAEVLDELKNHPGLRGKKKVLLVDATKIPAHWPLFLDNGFARGLDDLGDSIAADENLIVISASSPSQRSWVSEEWGKSIFAQKVMEGLQGAADLDRNGRITAGELFHFIRDEVKKWTWANRGVLQTPRMWPQGDLGEQRADQVELAGVDGKYVPTPPSEAPGASFSYPDWLQQAWQKQDGLRAALPSPAAYSPHLWRHYQAALLRCEDLVRAGSEPTARALYDGLVSDLEGKIDEARRLETPRALGYSLAMPRGLGGSPPLSDKDLEAIHGRTAQLWDEADEAQRQKKGQQLHEWVQAQQGREKLLRLEFYDWILRQVLKGEDAELDARLKKAHQLFSLSGWLSNEQPIEALFLAMLDRHLLAKRPEPALLRLALHVRRLAEEVTLGMGGEGRGTRGEEEKNLIPHPSSLSSPYAERVWPWIRSTVAGADALRRLGEDRLFATDPKEWARADRLLREAEKEYRSAGDTAAQVRRALRLCEEAYSSLPYFSQWLARSDKGVDPQLEGQIITLWKDVFPLDDRLCLQSPSPCWVEEDQGPDRGQRSLAKQSADLAKRLGDLQKTFLDHCRPLIEAPALQDNWHRIADALPVPLLDAELRVALVKRLRKISNDLNTETSQAPGGVAPPTQESSEKARTAAVRQGTLALAVLGSARCNTDKEPDRFERWQRFLGQEDWARGVLATGEQISRLYQDLPGEIQTLADQAAEADKPEENLLRLARAERLCRQADGGLIPAVNPVARQRRWQTHDLLVDQSRRTLRDLWWSETGQANPYFRVAGGAYLDDADRLLEDSAGGAVQKSRGVITSLRQTLSRTPMLAFRCLSAGESVAGRLVTQIAGDPEFTLRYVLESDLTGWSELQVDPRSRGEDRGTRGEGQKPLSPHPSSLDPLGVPVIRVDLEKGQALESIPENQAALQRWSGRQPMELRKDQVGEVALTLKNPLRLLTLTEEEERRKASGEEERPPIQAELTLRGLFRGRLFDLPATLQIAPSADNIVYQHPTPPTSGVAVVLDSAIADQFGGQRGMVALVLDLSGSMKLELPGEKTTRFQAAIDALTGVLNEVPEGTIVSVMVFGQRNNLDKPLGENKWEEWRTRAEGGNFERHEQTVQELLAPCRWNKDVRDRLNERVRALAPDYETPLVRAMWRAKKQIQDARARFPDELKGRKTMVVLTDGADNRFQFDTELQDLHNTKSIPEFLQKEFDHQGIAVNLVLFQATSKEQAEVDSTFGILSRLTPAGEIYNITVASIPALARSLRDALGLRLSYRLRQDRPIRPLNSAWQDLEMFPTSNWPNWYYVPSGPYNITSKANLREWQDLSLEAGDLLLLRYTPGGRFRRALLTEWESLRKSPQAIDPQERYRLIVLQNERTINNRHALLAAVERLSAQDELRQMRPREVWFEVKSEIPNPKSQIPNPAGPRRLIWGNAGGFAAPAWDLFLSEILPKAELTAWVRYDGPPSVPLIPEGGPPIEWRKPFQRRVGGQQVTVELSHEEHTVASSSGKSILANCLIVRALYEGNRPVYARLPNLNRSRDGYEQFYHAGGKYGHYTGIFWFGGKQTDEELRRRATQAELVAVQEFQEDPGTVKLPVEPGPPAPPPTRPTRFDRLEELQKYAGKE